VLCTRVSSVATKGDDCFEPASPLSRRTGQVLGACRLVLVMSFYADHYIVGMFVTGAPNEVCYSQINFCNEL
jgi:hypothetical protein